MARSVVCSSLFSALLYSLFFLELEALGPDGYLYSTHGGVSSSDFKFPVLLRERREAQAEVTLPSVTTTTAAPSSTTLTQNVVKSTDKGPDFPDVKEPFEKPVKPIKYTKKPTLPDKKPYEKPQKKPKVVSTMTVVPSSTEPTTPVKTTAKEPSTTISVKPETTTVDEYDDVDDDIHSINITGYDTNDTMHFSHHKYYKSASYSGEEVIDNFWVDLNALPPNMTKESNLLSSAHRQALTVSLSFIFPFYGHRVQNITIATGGFLYTGEILHTWLAATQYIAPLMANFDTRASPDSKVRYADNGTALTVEWENVRLQEAENISSSMTDGPFTFQVTIHDTGDIVFSYKDVPLQVDRIGDTEHPVKVGLSDAYIVKKTIFYVRRKTIYEYHKIDMKKPKKISNTTAIVFKALPTCVSFGDCESCLKHNTSFHCRWCGQVGRCSDGTDRMRQDWLLSRCDFFNTDELSKCAFAPTPHTTRRNGAEDGHVVSDGGAEAEAATAGVVTESPSTELNRSALVEAVDSGVPQGDGASGVGAGLAISIIVGLVLCCVLWVGYAYFCPHTTSGQLLIRYRPSTWSFKRSGPRYTAAAMHSIHIDDVFSHAFDDASSHASDDVFSHAGDDVFSHACDDAFSHACDDAFSHACDDASSLGVSHMVQIPCVSLNSSKSLTISF